jgi:hypothetical protein
MKPLRLFSLLLLSPLLAWAQPPVPVPASPALPDLGSAALRTAEELDQLLAPIALYPDALIALILPAATASTDIVLAARHVRDNPNDRSQIEHRAWDESVKSLTNYPEVLLWMDENLTWTKQVGEAFATQPADVMQAVQRLRAKARAAGTLVDTPQQQVIAEPQVIRIVPAQPDVIYVPRYEPEIVFVDRPVYYTRPFLSFGVGVPVGSWLAFECDWHRNAIWVGNRHRPWHRHDWRKPLLPATPGGRSHSYTRAPEVRQWRPPTVSRPSSGIARHFRPEIARPTPIAPLHPRSFTPNPPVVERRWNDTDRRGGDGDRRWNSPGRTPTVIAPLPRAIVPATPSTNQIGPRPQRSVTSPPVSIPRMPVAGAPATATVVSPPSHRRAGDWSRDSSNRGQALRTLPARPIAVVPALPMANPPPAGADLPTVAPARSYSRSNAASANPPAVVGRRGAPAVAPTTEASPAPARAQTAAPAERSGGGNGRWNGRPHNSIGR